MRTVSTIGYEGADLDAFVYTLGAAGIDCLLDVREVAGSRRPGFSKNALRQHLALAGIEYIHFRQLGDPKKGREAMRRGNRDEFRRIFLGHMESEGAQRELEQAIALASERAIVLLCYERNPTDCHRTIIAEKMNEQGTFAIRHLGVQSNRRIVDAKGADRDVTRIR